MGAMSSAEQLAAPPFRPKTTYVFSEAMVTIPSSGQRLPGLIVDAYVECPGGDHTIGGVALIVEAESKNPLIFFKKPFGMLGVRDLLEAAEAEGVCPEFNLDAPVPLAEEGDHA